MLCTGHQRRGENICRRNYYDTTDGIIFVIDSFDRKRLDEAGEELRHLLEVCSFAPTPILQMNV
jgi:GTPase SAR1 family protein